MRARIDCEYADGGCADPACSVAVCKERDAEQAAEQATANRQALADQALLNAEIYRQAEEVLRRKRLPRTKANIEKAARHPKVRELATKAIERYDSLPPISLSDLKLPRK